MKLISLAAFERGNIMDVVLFDAIRAFKGVSGGTLVLYPSVSIHHPRMPTSSVGVTFTPADMQADDPVAIVEGRAIRELRLRYNFQDDELDFVASSPYFHESAREKVAEAIRAFEGGLIRKPKAEVELVIEFDRPGTRGWRMKEVD